MNENFEVSDSEIVKMSKFKSIFVLVLAIVFIVCAAALFTFNYLSKPPSDFLAPVTLEVEKGMPVKEIALLAKENNIVRSELLLYAIITSLYDPTNVHAGRYIFEKPYSVFDVAEKISSNEVDEILVSLTIPEGMTAKMIADIASEVLPEFKQDEYFEYTAVNEGFLFPDTYFVPETFTARDLFKLQSATFVEKVRPIELAAPTSTFSSTEVMTLASIIEREANSVESMKMVSGILRNRLDIDMPLQADATIEYVLDTPINQLKPGELAENLRKKKSPYNTYLNTGLPPTPIGNPGLVAIEAALNPTLSDYFYYITGDDGEFYYAKNFAEHNRNIDRYLK